MISASARFSKKWQLVLWIFYQSWIRQIDLCPSVWSNKRVKELSCQMHQIWQTATTEKSSRDICFHIKECDWATDVLTACLTLLLWSSKMPWNSGFDITLGERNVVNMAHSVKPILILGSKKIIQDIGWYFKIILSNVIIKYSWQRYVMETRHLTFFKNFVYWCFAQK